MTTCDYCERAHAGLSGTFDTRCAPCRARLVARTQAAWDAMHPAGSRDAAELIAMIARALHDIDAKEAKRMVWEWWKNDHRPEMTGVTA